jgi:hypothetical protein
MTKFIMTKILKFFEWLMGGFNFLSNNKILSVNKVDKSKVINKNNKINNSQYIGRDGDINN